MRAKSAARKNLLQFSDVFADILNVFLFHGKQVVDSKQLEDRRAGSQSVSGGALSGQESTVSKYCSNAKLQLVPVFTPEGSAALDETQTLPLYGMLSADYLEQYARSQETAEGMSAENAVSQEQSFCPVFSFVLYFGDTPWPEKCRLSDVVPVPEEFRPFFQDYQPQVFQVSFLTLNEIQLFRSDFRYVADFLVQKRLNRSRKPEDHQVPTPADLTHAREVYLLLKDATGEDYYTMCGEDA